MLLPCLAVQYVWLSWNLNQSSLNGLSERMKKPKCQWEVKADMFMQTYVHARTNAAWRSRTSYNFNQSVLGSMLLIIEILALLLVEVSVISRYNRLAEVIIARELNFQIAALRLVNVTAEVTNAIVENSMADIRSEPA